MSYYLNTMIEEENDIPDDYCFMNPVKDNLLNADQALKITNEYKTNMYNVTIDKIATNIRGAASQGKTDTLFFLDKCEYLAIDLVNTLTEYGYNVKYNKSTQRDPAELVISWKEH